MVVIGSTDDVDGDFLLFALQTFFISFTSFPKWLDAKHFVLLTTKTTKTIATTSNISDGTSYRMDSHVWCDISDLIAIGRWFVIAYFCIVALDKMLLATDDTVNNVQVSLFIFRCKQIAEHLCRIILKWIYIRFLHVFTPLFLLSLAGSRFKIDRRIDRIFHGIYVTRYSFIWEKKNEKPNEMLVNIYAPYRYMV